MGDILKDEISGFQGKVIVISFYSTGCTHYGLASTKLKEDGTVYDVMWFDESRMILIKTRDNKKPKDSRSGPDINPKCY
jgi:hypothetical protein